MPVEPGRLSASGLPKVVVAGPAWASAMASVRKPREAAVDLYLSATAWVLHPQTETYPE